MSLSQLTTLITETEERLTQMKAIATQLQEKAAKKTAKKTSKKPDFAPEFSDEGGMFDSDVPRTPVSKKGKHVPDAPKKPAALPVLPKSPVAPPAAEPKPEPKKVSAWAMAMKEVYAPLVKEALNGEKMPNGLLMKVAGYLNKSGNEKPTLDDVKAAIEFLQNNPDYKSDTAMRRASDSSSETSAKKRGRPKKTADATE